MTPKFNIGDILYCEDIGPRGIVISIDLDKNCYILKSIYEYDLNRIIPLDFDYTEQEYIAIPEAVYNSPLYKLMKEEE